MAGGQVETLFWHDYETSGTDTRRDRPLQFAGVRTDSELNVIEDPLVIYARPSDDFLPHPMACMITGITPQKALEEGYPEAEFIDLIHQQMARPGTCSVGFNSLRFDDEITRNTLYRNFFDPYAREWQNGCSRWDIIDMLRLTRALRPEGINWPLYADGTPSLRLEDLTAANGIDHGNAHDALSDVKATIAVAKLVKQAQPKLYDYVLQNRTKARVQAMLDTERMKPVLHVSSKYPVEHCNLALVAPLVTQPGNPNATLVWDLRYDPQPLFERSTEELRQLLFTRHDELPAGAPKIALKAVHVNRCPILAPATMLSGEEAARFAIDGESCRQHLALLRNEPGLLDKIRAIYDDKREAEADPDLAIYSGGFFSQDDRRLIDKVRQADADTLGDLDLPFQDTRLEEMFLRYKARNYPHTLSEGERHRWEEYRSHKLLSGENGYLSFDQLYEQMNRIAADPATTDSQRVILEELALYAESIYPMEIY